MSIEQNHAPGFADVRLKFSEQKIPGNSLFRKKALTCRDTFYVAFLRYGLMTRIIKNLEAGFGELGHKRNVEAP